MGSTEAVDVAKFELNENNTDLTPLPNENDYYKPTKKTGRRHFPGMTLQSYEEWTFYPEGYNYGKRCTIEGQHIGNSQTTREVTLTDVIGRTRKGMNQRAGLPMMTDGDKSYAVPEYSYNFHKVGSTLPAINFSRSSKLVSDTFIPLQPLQAKPRRPYMDKHKARIIEEEKMEVAKLSKWKPAPSLTPSL
ncbi:spermatogenesis-associated serine-rich protein 1-like [Rhopilema esculentum]|uniref:spermatogenesis-associated serine-rich protein 1-like n=1 Tax=Rhopilema esculentum TaxID=499914 RepID=UPI0031CF8065